MTPASRSYHTPFNFLWRWTQRMVDLLIFQDCGEGPVFKYAQKPIDAPAAALRPLDDLNSLLDSSSNYAESERTGALRCNEELKEVPLPEKEAMEDLATALAGLPEKKAFVGKPFTGFVDNDDSLESETDTAPYRSKITQVNSAKKVYRIVSFDTGFSCEEWGYLDQETRERFLALKGAQPISELDGVEIDFYDPKHDPKSTARAAAKAVLKREAALAKVARLVAGLTETRSLQSQRLLEEDDLQSHHSVESEENAVQGVMDQLAAIEKARQYELDMKEARARAPPNKRI